MRLFLWFSNNVIRDESTVLTLDLASNQLMLDGVSSEFYFKDKSQLEALTDLLIDTLGQHIRWKTKKLFQIETKLYISRWDFCIWKKVWNFSNYKREPSTHSENHTKCRIWIFQSWHFPPIFVLLKLTCLVTLFDRKLQAFKNSPTWTIFGIST